MSFLDNSRTERKPFKPKSKNFLGRVLERADWLCDKEELLKTKCTCGKYDGDCVSDAYLNKHTGSMHRDVRTMFKCGKFQKNLEALRKLKINQGTNRGA